MKRANSRPRTEARPRWPAIEGPIRNSLAGKAFINVNLAKQLHELWLHQAELEARLDHYADLYDAAPAAYFTLDRNGLILEANLAGAGLLATSRPALIGRRLADFIAGGQHGAFADFLKQVFCNGAKETCEFAFVDASGNSFFAQAAVNAAPSGPACRVVLCDISECKQTEQVLIESEEWLRVLADSAPVLVWIADADQQYWWFNQMWLDFTGRTLEQELGCGWTQGIHPEDLQDCLELQAAAFQTQQPFSMEYRLRNRDGHYRYVLAHGVPRSSPSGRFLGYTGSCTDISERKKAEEALQHSRQMLRHLVSYQERVREDERKRIAREIHDDLGQNLLALRIDVSMLHTRTGAAHPKLNERVRIALSHIDATMKAVRAAINNLRPTALDLGLNAAIEWQVQDFQRRSNIACELTMEDDFVLDDNRATALFRILQESLNNVTRHAQASEVRIGLYKDGDKLIMRVADNGIGIYPDCSRKTNSFVLVGIKERINALGGDLHIDSSRNNGTMLAVSLPIRSV